jgi:hypothetical protein
MINYIDVAKSLYPNFEPYELTTYTPIINYFGKVIISHSDDDWSGDTIAIIQHPTSQDMIGYLQFGWGSCSGCDRLKACENYNDLAKLIENMENSIIWKHNESDMVDWINNRDWEAQFIWSNESLKNFLINACELLNGNCLVNFEPRKIK